jgi:hypothetical protein
VENPVHCTQWVKNLSPPLLPLLEPLPLPLFSLCLFLTSEFDDRERAQTQVRKHGGERKWGKEEEEEKKERGRRRERDKKRRRRKREREGREEGNVEPGKSGKGGVWKVKERGRKRERDERRRREEGNVEPGNTSMGGGREDGKKRVGGTMSIG